MTVIKKQPLEVGQLKEYAESVNEGLETADAYNSLDQAHDMIVQDTRDALNSSMSQEGDVWIDRKKVGDGHPLLMDTGKLMQAATGGGAGHINDNDGRNAVFGIDADTVPYAAIHQGGGVTRPMPQRKYFGATEQTEDAIDELIADEMIEVF